jgi:hypothetical protein
MQVTGIEGGSLAAEPVVMFTELVYRAFERADAAREFVETAEFVLEDLADMEMSLADIRRFRAAITRSGKMRDQIRELADGAGQLVPQMMEACAFDADLRRYRHLWTSATAMVGRVDRAWSRMVTATVPMARVAAGRVMYQLAAAGADGMPPADTAPLLDPVTMLLASEPTCLNRTDPIRTSTPREVLDGMMGALIHLTVSPPSTMTLFPTERPEHWVRLTLGTENRMLLESPGDRDLPAGARLSHAQRLHLRELGLTAPGRRSSERNWRVVLEDFDPFGTITAAASILVNVHGLRQGEALTVVTDEINIDVPSTDGRRRPRRGAPAV